MAAPPATGAFPLAEFIRPRPTTYPVSMHSPPTAVVPFDDRDDHDGAPPPPSRSPSGPALCVASASPSQAPSVFHVYLSRWYFCACWWLVVVCHAFLGSFAFGATALHRYLQDEEVADSVAALHATKPTLRMTARVFFLVGFAHAVAIARLVYFSARARELVLHSPPTTPPSSHPFQPLQPKMALLQCLLRAYDAVADAWEQLFSPTGLFGFSGAYFEAAFTGREAWEILMQTYQAYKLSQSVPRQWLNQLAVAAIVLNCVSSPLAHWRFRHDEGLRRLANLALDALLDGCCSVVIPLCVILPYAGVYDTESKRIPTRLLLDDVWFVDAISEMRQVLVTSLPDFVSTVVPQLSLLGYLMTFKSILRRRSASVRDQPTFVFPLAKRDAIRASVAPLSLGPTLPPPSRKTVIHRVAAHNAAARRCVSERLQRDPGVVRHWLSAFVHVLFVAWGVVVLALHLEALQNTDRRLPGCQLHVSAWHSDGFPCSVMQLNCHADGIEGSREEITALLAPLARSSLQVLIFSHCPALHVAPMVTEFDQLAGIELFNCSLVDWPMEAAVREARQPKVGYVYFILSNWTSFPAGLLHNELPGQLKHLSVIGNNLTELPDEIDLWDSQDWISFNFDRVPNLRALPMSLCRLRILSLWFANSGLTAFPRECMETTQVVELALSGSPLLELPDVVGTNLRTLLLEYTNVSQVPAWFSAWDRPAKEVYLYGSPLCETPELRRDAARWTEICGEDVGTTGGQYLWPIMLPLRPYDVDHDDETARFLQ